MKSFWQDGNFCPEFPPVIGNLATEILVIGGGMAGILCAMRLKEAGKKVMVAEANRIGSGITARTTAVLTAQHDYLYQDMVKDFDTQTAKAYLHANLDAVEAFRKLSKKIDCDFEDMPSIQFHCGNSQRLQKEAEIVNKLGYAAQFQKHVALPVEANAAVLYPNMGQFHPLKFIGGIAKDLEIFENSRVLKLEGTTAHFARGSIRAKQVIVATHFPFINRHGLYFMKLYQSRSYVLALENAPNPGASMAELEGQGMYFRRWGDRLLVGGGDHRTGKKGGGFAYLRDYVQRHFPQAKEVCAWANQDCMSLDKLPYVGIYSPNTPNVYVATGFNAWGMTNSMVAANVLTDMISGRENVLAKILRPDRSVMHVQLFSNIGTTLMDFAIPSLKRCPHMGCTLRWNPQEHSWDCPCHGSRFAEDGKLLETPAQKDANL